MGRKRKRAAVADVVVISEASEEDMLRTPVLRKQPDKDNLFDFELEEDGMMALLPVNPFWPFWQWSKVVEKHLEDLERAAKAWKDEVREQREKVKEVEKEVKRLRERVVELERRGKEKNRCTCLDSETYMSKKHWKHRKSDGTREKENEKKVGVETQIGEDEGYASL